VRHCIEGRGHCCIFLTANTVSSCAVKIQEIQVTYQEPVIKKLHPNLRGVRV